MIASVVTDVHVTLAPCIDVPAAPAEPLTS